MSIEDLILSRVYCGFRFPDGPLVGQVCGSGNSRWADAITPSQGVVVAGEYTNVGWPDNTYMSLPNTSVVDGIPDPIEHLGCSFRIMQNCSGMTGTIIADSAGLPFQDMVHYQFGPSGWRLDISTSGYPPFTYVNNAGLTLKQGQTYSASLDLDYSLNSITVIDPDGTIWVNTGPVITALFANAKPKIARFQCYGGIDPGLQRYKYVWVGRNRCVSMRSAANLSG